MCEDKVAKSVAPVTDVVDDAVGVSKSYWFVAVVNYNSEKQVAEKLDRLGVENYLPTQTEVRVWRNGRKSKVDKVVIPTVIFVRCTESKRREIVNYPFIFRFMTDRASAGGASGTKSLAVVSDAEIDRLKFMLGQSDIPVEICQVNFRQGDKIKVIRGKLAGLEGEVMEQTDSEANVIVRIALFGCARLKIDPVNLERI